MHNSPQDFPDELVLADHLLTHHGVQLSAANLVAGPARQKQIGESALTN